MTKKTKQMRIKNIPVEIHREFKIACTRREIGMNDRVIELMRKDAVDKGKGKGG